MLRPQAPPAEGGEQVGDVEAAEVLREGNHAEGVQAQPQRVALHTRVLARHRAQVHPERLRATKYNRRAPQRRAPAGSLSRF